MNGISLRAIALTTLLTTLPVSGVKAADWPMWRYDAGRGASSPETLAGDLHLRWVRALTAASPAWPPTQKRLQFDTAAQPVAAEGRLFVPSSANDTVTAYNLATGEQLWQFFAEGPVRFAPIAARGRVWFVSDDGCLYCLSADEGHLLWKFRAGPAQRRVLGNRRLVSSWPARGGPVLHDDKVYFAASIWPFMGIFVHAVDSHTGKAVWTNSGDGTNWTVHPHSAPAFGTVVPQGHLAVTGNYLVVPGGRSVPAVYDTRTGKLLSFVFDKNEGGHDVMATGGIYFVGGSAYAARTGRSLGSLSPAVLEDSLLLTGDGGRLRGFALGDGTEKTTTRDRRGHQVAVEKLSLREQFRGDIIGDLFIKAGRHVYTAGGGRVAAYEITVAPGGGREIKQVWSADIEDEVWSMLAADGHLVVVTRDNRLWCFGPDKPAGQPERLAETVQRGVPSDDVMAARAAEMLQHNEAGEGYCVALGIGSGRLVEALLARSKLYVIVVDADADKVDAFRRRMHARQLYGARVSAHVGEPASFAFPPYLANLLVAEDADLGGIDPATYSFDVLRPYGGRAVLALGANQLAAAKRRTDLQVHADGQLTHLVRAGALPGSDDWTHQYGNAARTVISDERNVKVPLGLLWFGGASHEGILPRHGHGPSPQVAGGRLFIEGGDMLRCVDVYTGRVLWQKQLPGFGTYYNITGHFPGAGEIGSNFVSLPDVVYAVYGSEILKIDAATGETLQSFTQAAAPGSEPPSWGYLGVLDDMLVATASPVAAGRALAKKAARPAPRLRPGDVPLIKLHDTWHYLAGRDPVGDWTARDFDSSSWPDGTAGFGYGDGDDRTKLNMAGKYARVYIRRRFDLPAGAAAAEAGLVINFDDAFIAYLNGREVLRVGVGAGRGADARRIKSHEAAGYVRFPLKNWKSLVAPGKNVLAIEGHNTSITSSDFSLDPALVVRGAGASSNGSPQPSPAKTAPATTGPQLPLARYASGSRHLVALDRHTGELLWRREAALNFRHNNIALAAGKVFCIDSLTKARGDALSRRGINLSGVPRLYALDARTGREIWSTSQDVFGTFLSYSPHHDILVQAGSAYRDRARDESGKGIVAYRGETGEVLWSRLDLVYGGPCMLLRDRIVTNGGGGFALDIQTGEPTGWTFQRQYGCNTAIGCQNLLTFRSGAAGFCDLAGDSGTGNLGGFRSSCTANLIPANGVLSAPDYTRTCTCAYQNQTSLALVHMPQAEFWTFGGKARTGRWGANFNAPGDRRSQQGTLWTARSDVAVEPREVDVFRFHSSLVETDPAASGGLPWVAASGLVGARRLTIPVEPGRYTVSLRLLEPETINPGERVFDVSLQGKRVLTDLDLVKTTGSRRRELERRFTVEAKDGKIVIELEAKTGRPVISGVEWIALPAVLD